MQQLTECKFVSFASLVRCFSEHHFEQDVVVLAIFLLHFFLSILCTCVHWFFVCFSMQRLTLETEIIVFIADFSTFAFQWIFFDKYDYTALAPIHFIQTMTSLVFTLTLLVVSLWNALLVFFKQVIRGNAMKRKL